MKPEDVKPVEYYSAKVQTVKKKNQYNNDIEIRRFWCEDVTESYVETEETKEEEEEE